MGKLVVESPAGLSKILSLTTPCLKQPSVVDIKLDTGAKFVISKFFVNMFEPEKIKSMQFLVTTAEQQPTYIPFFYYIKDSNVMPSNLTINPLVARGIRILIEYEDINTSFPGIGIEYYETNMMITDPPEYIAYEVTPTKQIFKNSGNEIWIPLKDAAQYILRVRRLNADIEFEDFEYAGERPRDVDKDIPVNSYYYDPVMQTIQIKMIDIPELVVKNIIVVEYSVSGCKAIVPIEAVSNGPMFDVDVGTLTQIHPDSLLTLPSGAIGWQTINDEEPQGGYRYWDSEWIDLVALEFNLPEGINDYLGRGINFQRVGVAPDSFDADVADYRSFWLTPSGTFPNGLWKTKAKGYTTFIGPPNTVVPSGIRVVAPQSIVKVDPAITDPQTIANSPRIPNGGINPAPLIITLQPSTANVFPSGVFARKTAAFRPRLMVYLRERVKFTGATFWKDVGDGYGESSEITGTPYWEA